MLKTLELSDTSSCLNKADDDEPLFVLLARDNTAPQTVRHWVTMNRRVQPDAKLTEALEWAASAEKYRAEREAKKREAAQPEAMPSARER